MDRLNTRFQGRPHQQNRPYKPYIYRGRGRDLRNHPSYNKDLTETNQITDKGLKIEIEEDTLLLYPNHEFIIIQEGHIESQAMICTKVKVDSPNSEVYPDPLPGDPEMHQCHLGEMITNALVVDSLVILPKNILRRTLL